MNNNAKRNWLLEVTLSLHLQHVLGPICTEFTLQFTLEFTLGFHYFYMSFMHTKLQNCKQRKSTWITKFLYNVRELAFSAQVKHEQQREKNWWLGGALSLNLHQIHTRFTSDLHWIYIRFILDLYCLPGMTF